MAKITIDGITKEYPQGTAFEEIARQYQPGVKDMIALVAENRKIRELHKKVERDCSLSFLTIRDDIGHKTYVRTGLMILVKAINDVLGKEKVGRVKIEFAIGQGYYCKVIMEEKLTREHVSAIGKRMAELVEKDLPITKKSYPKDQAIELFRSHKLFNKEKLFRYRRSSSVNVYCLDGYYDYYYGYMLPSTGYLKYFDVLHYEDGIMLLLPGSEDPTKLNYFAPMEKLFHTLTTSSRWGEMMGIESVGDLNNSIRDGLLGDMILVQEALQERRIGEIAREIVDRGNVKFVLIAGPSSSGKTTFSHRLAIQLRTYGLIPHPIALDDYFINRVDTPKDADGNYDFECLEAIDIKKFNEDMNLLLAGEAVELPQYNFKLGKREYHGNIKKLGSEDVLVIEGIHGLNPVTTASMPDESKFKIYISALTSLNVDDHNRIPTTDGRLLRRIVRDARTRGNSAKRTIAMWPSVRRGEEKYIFPFQESADEMFNSALIYELAVLKQYVEPLLFGIEEGEPEYYEAKRLLKFLEYFQGIDSQNVPANSICREFIGGSCFRV
ncbi:MAG: nucleoside kinase [Lachnospiraceae bacterium]|nr:nucleoside kinase [Lachnospiraceae bacterium]